LAHQCGFERFFREVGLCAAPYLLHTRPCDRREPRQRVPVPLAWGVRTPDPTHAPVAITGVAGTVCLDVSSNTFGRCSRRGVGQQDGRWKTVLFGERLPGEGIRTHEGYFEFDVTIR
jgi:hypothetical protein